MWDYLQKFDETDLETVFEMIRFSAVTHRYKCLSVPNLRVKGLPLSFISI